MSGFPTGLKLVIPGFSPTLSVIFKVNKMGWVNTKDRMPVVGQALQCRLKHCTTGKILEERLVRVAEDDCVWRTAQGRYEVSYDWDVIEWEDSSAA